MTRRMPRMPWRSSNCSSARSSPNSTPGMRTVPDGWVARMRESMARLTPRFSTNRSVREYLERYYLPTAEQFHARSADGCSAGARIVASRLEVQRRWPQLRITELKIEAMASQLQFELRVTLGELSPRAVRAELYADALRGGQPERHRFELPQRVPGSTTEYRYRMAIPATRAATDYTARLVPDYGVSAPLEESLVLWQR